MMDSLVAYGSRTIFFKLVHAFNILTDYCHSLETVTEPKLKKKIQTSEEPSLLFKLAESTYTLKTLKK